MFKELVFWLLVYCWIFEIHGKKNEIRQTLKHTKLNQLQKLLVQLKKHRKALSCVCDLMKENRKINTKPDKGVQGYVYTRWGKKTCGNDSVQSELIYAGQVAGSDNSHHPGAAVNYLCLPQTPIYGYYDSKENSIAYVYGAEIDLNGINIPGTPFENGYNTKSIYCAVCRTIGRTSVVMIPGRNQCFPGWTREYHGYLSAGHYSHKGASEYICLDAKPDIFSKKSHSWHKMLYPVEGRCTGPLKCPPYVNGRQLTCVVCSK